MSPRKICVLAALLFCVALSAAEPKSDSTRLGLIPGINRELAGGCHYSPDCYHFFIEAVGELGAVPAVFATADRLTRCSIIGTTLRKNRAEDGLIHEGVEPYRLRHKAAQTSAGMPGRDVVARFIPGSRPVSEDFDFVNYMIDNKMSADALAYLENTGFQPSDSLMYLLGWSSYSAKNLDKAYFYFSSVPQGSVFFDKSLFFAVVCSAHQGRYQEGLDLLNSYGGPMTELRSYQLAGLSLLTDNAEGYAQAAKDFTYSSFALAGGEKQMDEIYASRFEAKQKNRYVAAAMSAIIPGAGKMYAGRMDEGVASLLTVGVLGGITAENWIKNGIRDWRTILFGTLSSIFYIGNIYGSYVSVGLYNLELKDAQNTAIVYNIHIPLRSVFN